ncbi:dTDP-4-amino-4,6-dideoxygalactose transaminase [bacterium]|nr:dTDP-4-amino-4,6-dideoxygalactose transaminase [bacterium]
MNKKTKQIISFQKPYFTGAESTEVLKTISNRQLIGPDNYIKKAENLLEKQLNCKKVLLTNSGTDALEMACILANFKNGDEVIIPSYNFPSSGTAVVRTGAKPIFVDISSTTMNLCIKSIEKSITKATKGIIIVHYAGISANIIEIIKLAKKFDLIIIEDAAPAIYSKHKVKFLGTFGHFGVLSFHFTKNIFCGEGGAILINKKDYVSRAYILREKGTNRQEFLDGKISKYSWVDIGSSFIPSSLQASFLFAQLNLGQDITKKRVDIFNVYHKFFLELSFKYKIKTMVLDTNNKVNGHFYWILIPKENRNNFIKTCKKNGMELTTHYEPLHSSKAGEKFGAYYSDLTNTEDLAKQIVRIPIHTEMGSEDQKLILKILYKTIVECLA